jgi:hypothetical protein
MARQGRGAVKAATSAAGSAMSSAAAAANRLFSKPYRAGPPPVSAIQGSMVRIPTLYLLAVYKNFYCYFYCRIVQLYRINLIETTLYCSLFYMNESGNVFKN